MLIEELKAKPCNLDGTNILQHKNPIGSGKLPLWKYGKTNILFCA